MGDSNLNLNMFYILTQALFVAVPLAYILSWEHTDMKACFKPDKAMMADSQDCGLSALL